MTVFNPTVTTSLESLSYTKTWSSGDDDILEITINPIPNSVYTNDIYLFNITLTANAFRSNQDRFHNIYFQMRLVTSQYTSVSASKGAYEINTLHQTISFSLVFFMPSQSTFSLTEGQTLASSLEYNIDYKLGLIFETDPSLTTDWESVGTPLLTASSNNQGISSIQSVQSSSSSDTISPDSNPSSIYIGIVILGLIGVLFIIYAVNQNKMGPIRPPPPPPSKYITQDPIVSKTPDNYNINQIDPTMNTTKTSFCNNCGFQMSDFDKFCPNCGHHRIIQ